jgi:glutamate-ammonia-ligase adenylyltransferase
MGLTDALFKDSHALPVPADQERATVGLALWREAGERAKDSNLVKFAKTLAADPAGRALIESVFGNSPYLGKTMADDLAGTRDILGKGPDSVVKAAIAAIAAPAKSSSELMARLRVAKRRASLAIGLADMCGRWNLKRVTFALSDLADAALDAAVAHLYPARSGYIVLGLGKLGGRELNYSSDIDLIVLYDPEGIAAEARDDPSTFFIRLTRQVVRLMEERTGDGYVFRTDLRLRPDPGSTPVAISTLAAEIYYESAGQNWERAAMIKARPVAGDLEAGAAFIDSLRPFVWRRNLDFAAILDIHSIKRQINAHRGGAQIAIAGHNIKLGRGGIREIEFFAQTQQLIWGGREPSLRARATKEALEALTTTGHIDTTARDELGTAYDFLRKLEHRLQMAEDQQTHTLPADQAGLEAVAKFMGFEGAAAFSEALLAELQTVEAHYAHLFEEAPALSGPGNLVFTGSDDDPETMATLTRMGYRDPHRVAEIVRAWHRGRYRAMRSAQARELMTELMPTLLEALAATADGDAALLKFDEFLAALPAGVQLLSLFHSNPSLLGLVAEIMGSAPRLADTLGRNAALIEGLLTGGAAELPNDAQAMKRELDAALAPSKLFEDALDAMRRWNNEGIFRIGVQVLRGAVDADRAGPALTLTAETSLAALAPRVEAEFARRSGALEGGGMAVVALGKLGGREMTFGSDLDLMFVYDAPGANPGYTRLSQRFIAAVESPTAEGKLYEVDMRLRPSGNKGPIATPLEGFVRYHREDAWTWEHMALTRARVVAGPTALKRRIEAAIKDVLTAKRDPAKLRADVAEMRGRMERELTKPGDIWELKHLRGGLVDVEFIAQYLQLLHGHDHPAVLDTNTGGALAILKEDGLIDERVAADLAGALHLWRNLQGMLRLTTGGAFDPAVASEGLKSALARAAEVERFSEVPDRIEAASAKVRRHFESLIGKGKK